MDGEVRRALAGFRTGMVPHAAAPPRSQLLIDVLAQHREVVVMAEADKAQMDSEVRRALAGFKNLEWHTRTGAPHCVTDLESVAAGQAQTIILLHPEVAQVRTSWLCCVQLRCFDVWLVNFSPGTSRCFVWQPGRRTAPSKCSGRIGSLREFADAVHAMPERTFPRCGVVARSRRRQSWASASKLSHKEFEM